MRLILIGVAPTAYALNRSKPDSAMSASIHSAQADDRVFEAYAQGCQRMARVPWSERRYARAISTSPQTAT